MRLSDQVRLAFPPGRLMDNQNLKQKTKSPIINLLPIIDQLITD